MKIVIAPDSYKESLSASEVAQAIEKGFREIFPDAQYVSVPVADGGEGTVEAMIAATQGSERHAWVTGPLGEKVNASWGISGDGKTAFIEMAAASGLELVPAEKRDPLVTTSRGTGELILQALESGATNIIIGIGGSATNDGGAGMVQALGAKLCDANGNEIGFGGGSLNTLNDIDISGLDPRLKDCAIRVACDVTNPLVGDNGASRIFGPQKGASEAMIVELDNKLASRSVNEGFSGGEKKRNEIFQMAMLEPKLAILDETDSGLDIDALRIVANGVNQLRTPENAAIVITHYQRLLDYIKPDIVHVLYKGRIVKTAGPELALELEEKGYDWIKKEMGE